MKAAIQTLGHVLYAPSQYVIPVFQRNYRWERPQWDKLWASLAEIQHPDKTGNHFMGFLVFVQGGVAQPGQNTRFHLIDGQQRLTTTSLLLAAIRNVALREQQAELAQEVNEYYLIHPLKKGENRCRLLPKAQDHDAYLAIIERKEPPAGRMADALAFFEGALAMLAAQDAAALRRMFDTVCQRLEFMCATLESENAYSIFKSLNSTGVPLGQADLIRNFVFMHVHPEQQDDFDQHHWAPLEAMFPSDSGRLDEERFSRFFRDVLMAEGQYVQPKDTFATFEARNEATGFAPAVLAAGLLARARHYAAIVGDANDNSTEVTLALAELNRLESSTTYPLLLALFAARDSGKLEATDLAACIDMLRGFIFRRFVAGESSRGYGQMFVRAIDTDAAHPVQALKDYLMARGWPHDARFVEAFSLFPLYKRGYAREVLETLERARGHKEAASLVQAQIEHVLPQTLSEEWAEALGEDAELVHGEWLHRPGNLTLSAYNQEVGNQPFAVKRARFIQSNVGLTREVAEHSQWTASEILVRGERMARDAAVLWTGPKESYATQDEPQWEQEAREVRLAFWSGFAEHVALHHPELPAIEPEPKRALRLKSRVPQVRLVLRFKVQDGAVAVVLRFKRAAFPAWQALRDAPEQANAWVGQAWNFVDSDGSETSMVLDFAPTSKDIGWWPALYDWLASKLALVHANALPSLRENMGAGVDDDDAEEEARPLTPTRQRQLGFWRQLVTHVVANSKGIRPQNPLPQHWLNISIGRAGFGIIPTLNQRVGRLGVEIMVAGAAPKEHFKVLLQQKEAVELQLGFPLEWQELPDAHQCRIVTWLPDSPLQDESRWGEYVIWMSDRIIRMDDVFRPLVRALP